MMASAEARRLDHARRVRAAFDRGADHYDLLVSLNPGYHRHLRFAANELIRRIDGARHRGVKVIDLGCGSGASTRMLAAAAPHGSRILGVDASAGMLQKARGKSWPDGVRFAAAEAGRLHAAGIGAGEWHGVLAAYLFRNVELPLRDAAIRDVYDLLEPGGWLVAQEYSVAGRRRAELVWNIVSWLIIMPLGILIDRNPGLYHYLWRSVREFDSTRRFMRRLADAGFVDVRTRTVTGWQRGILHTFVARKPRTT